MKKPISHYAQLARKMFEERSVTFGGETVVYPGGSVVVNKNVVGISFRVEHNSKSDFIFNFDLEELRSLLEDAISITLKTEVEHDLYTCFILLQYNSDNEGLRVESLYKTVSGEGREKDEEILYHKAMLSGYIPEEIETAEFFEEIVNYISRPGAPKNHLNANKAKRWELMRYLCQMSNIESCEIDINEPEPFENEADAGVDFDFDFPELGVYTNQLNINLILSLLNLSDEASLIFSTGYYGFSPSGGALVSLQFGIHDVYS